VSGADRATITKAMEYRRPARPTTVAVAPADRSNDRDD
jgi:hypothetical protein